MVSVLMKTVLMEVEMGGVHPADGVGGDRSVDQVGLRQIALEQSHSLGITFNFCGGKKIIVPPPQQDGDLAGVG